MTTLVLIRHAENDFMRNGRLAGWTPDVHLNGEGKRQAEELGKKLATAHIEAIYSSPLERAIETAEAIVTHHNGMSIEINEGIGEVHYGDWTGKHLRQLGRTRLWQVVQHNPSSARFPDGESIREMQSRAVACIENLSRKHPSGMVVAISHGDVIKAIVAHYSGIHLDLFQRIMVAPASVSVIGLHRTGAHIVRLNDTCHYEHNHPGQER